ncbi:MAG TPA: glycerate kinase [Chryseosolibacter sp.]
MVRILIAPDKFKGSLTAQEVCDIISEYFGGKKNYRVTTLPLADGGEGTFEILLNHFQGRAVETIVHDPLMRKISATYGLSGDGKTALIEMAKASGLQLLKTEDRNPLQTTTYGTGELIAHALTQGVRNIVLGIGGSATNDAGVGMATALGYKFFDQRGSEFIPLGGSDLSKIHSIDRTVHHQLAKVNVMTLCDVKNPLTGANGASHVFAPQKGAGADDVLVLEMNMLHFQRLLAERFIFDATFEGAGAAGGLGAGSKFFLDSTMVSGMQYIADVTDLKKKIADSDIVITGEGKLDTQSSEGKVAAVVSQIAKSNNKRVVVVCGICDLDPTQLTSIGIDECLELAKGVTLEYSLKNSTSLIRQKLSESRVLRDL